jgi:hypothetical protein
MQQETIAQLGGDMERHGVTKIQEWLDKTQMEKLRRRIDYVLRKRENQLCLGAFLERNDLTESDQGPSNSTGEPDTLDGREEYFAVDDDGFARDPRFKELCHQSSQMFTARVAERGSEQVVERDLAPLSVPVATTSDSAGEMYDAVHRPAPAARAGDVEMVTEENRLAALSMIQGRLAEFQEKVAKIQCAALVAALESEILKQASQAGHGQFAAENQRQVRERILAAFRARQIPLLPSVVAE